MRKTVLPKPRKWFNQSLRKDSSHCMHSNLIYSLAFVVNWFSITPNTLLHSPTPILHKKTPWKPIQNPQKFESKGILHENSLHVWYRRSKGPNKPNGTRWLTSTRSNQKEELGEEDEPSWNFLKTVLMASLEDEGDDGEICFSIWVSFLWHAEEREGERNTRTPLVRFQHTKRWRRWMKMWAGF